MNKLSVVLATFNEEEYIGNCLDSVKEIADEIIVVDGTSKDNTVKIANKYGARVVIRENPKIFHINKQKALSLASNDWVLQLDADERVSKELASEVLKVININDNQINKYQQNLKQKELFDRHQKLIEERDGKIGKDARNYAGYFVPRLNYFLGKYLRYGGVYPDGVIRLVRKNSAHFPCKSVHEQIVIDGKVGWLQNPLYHCDSPNFKRYLQRNSRYIDLLKDDMEQGKIKKSIGQFINYSIFKPVYWFFSTQFRHKGILDGWQGIVFSFFSALRFPRAYYRYLIK